MSNVKWAGKEPSMEQLKELVERLIDEADRSRIALIEAQKLLADIIDPAFQNTSSMHMFARVKETEAKCREAITHKAITISTNVKIMSIYNAVMRGGPADGKLYAVQHEDVFFWQSDRDTYAHYEVCFPANQQGIHDARYIGEVTKSKFEQRLSIGFAGKP